MDGDRETLESLAARLGSGDAAANRECLVAIARRGRDGAPASPAVCAFVRETGDRVSLAVAFDCLGAIHADSSIEDALAGEAVLTLVGCLA